MRKKTWEISSRLNTLCWVRVISRSISVFSHHCALIPVFLLAIFCFPCSLFFRFPCSLFPSSSLPSLVFPARFPHFDCPIFFDFLARFSRFLCKHRASNRLWKTSEQRASDLTSSDYKETKAMDSLWFWLTSAQLKRTNGRKDKEPLYVHNGLKLYEINAYDS